MTAAMAFWHAGVWRNPGFPGLGHEFPVLAHCRTGRVRNM